MDKAKHWDKILNNPIKLPLELVARAIYPAFHHRHNPKLELAKWMQKNHETIDKLSH